MSRGIFFVTDSDLRCGAVGLTAQSKKKGFDPSDLKRGETIVFTNAKLNLVKVMAKGPLSLVVAQTRAADGGRIDPRYIASIAETFDGGAMDFNKGVEQGMRKVFPKFFEKAK